MKILFHPTSFHSYEVIYDGNPFLLKQTDDTEMKLADADVSEEDQKFKTIY